MATTSLETLNALEARIQRVEWHLSGETGGDDVLHDVKAGGRDQTVQARLGRLEDNLARISSRSQVVSDLLKLCTSALRIWHLLLTLDQTQITLISSSPPFPTSLQHYLQMNHSP